MREILFRGRRLPDYEWVEGYYCKYGHTGAEKNYIIPVYASVLYAFDVIPETVGQYTGLTDKNRKKIFEGDIVKARLKPLSTFPNCYAIGKVIFENGTFKISVFKSSNETEYKKYTGENVRAYPIENNFIDRGYQLEVIGNIHDTPELLEG